jgi:hypothetical protein
MVPKKGPTRAVFWIEPGKFRPGYAYIEDLTDEAISLMGNISRMALKNFLAGKMSPDAGINLILLGKVSSVYTCEIEQN